MDILLHEKSLEKQYNNKTYNEYNNKKCWIYFCVILNFFWLIQARGLPPFMVECSSLRAYISGPRIAPTKEGTRFL
jgi:hypothetical protein